MRLPPGYHGRRHCTHLDEAKGSIEFACRASEVNRFAKQKALSPSPDITGAIKTLVAEDEVELCPALRHCWPKSDRLMDQSEANVLAYIAFPAKHWTSDAQHEPIGAPPRSYFGSTCGSEMVLIPDLPVSPNGLASGSG